MSFLLDTNAVSEWVKPRPDPGLVAWLDEVDEDRTFLSVVTLGELRKGVECLADGRRKGRLAHWLTEDLAERFAGRLIPIDARVADEWGRLLAGAEVAGTSVGGVDALIAATARVYSLAIVTRNVSDFTPTGVELLCPWSG